MSESTDTETDRVDELEELIEIVDENHQARFDDAIVPQIEGLQEQAEQATEQRDRAIDRLDAVEQRLTVLEERVENIAGLADDQETNPDKRLADLKEAMIRRAEARGQKDGYERVAMWWKEVQDLFADYGHGTISKPDCYKAMNDATATEGFELGTKVNPNGNEVKAIRLNLGVLRADDGGSNPTTPQPAAADGGYPSDGANGGVE